MSQPPNGSPTLGPGKVAKDTITAVLLILAAVGVEWLKQAIGPVPAAIPVVLAFGEFALILGAIIEIISAMIAAVRRIGELIEAVRSAGLAAALRDMTFGKPTLDGLGTSFAWGALIGLIAAGFITAASYISQAPPFWFWLLVAIAAVLTIVIFLKILIDYGPTGGLVSGLSTGFWLLAFAWLIATVMSSLGVIDRFIAPDLFRSIASAFVDTTT